jgi:hypothetical protein
MTISGSGSPCFCRRRRCRATYDAIKDVPPPIEIRVGASAMSDIVKDEMPGRFA